MKDLLTDGAKGAPQFLFAHGAGGAMDTPFMNAVARGLAGEGFRVVRFEFPYMAARRVGQTFQSASRAQAGKPAPHLRKSGAPDREPVLLDAWRDVVARCGGGAKVAIGGKSLGGRMASLVADELGVRALVCFGYPFHPPGRPERLRTAHLKTLRTPALIIQGTRDPFGGEDDVAGYGLSKSIRVEWLPDGDHSFRPRKTSGYSEKDHLQRAVALAAAFLRRHLV